MLLNTHRKLAAAGTNATNIKTDGGTIYSLIVQNTTAAAKYLKLYDKATAPTVGTDTPKMTIMVPANGTIVLNDVTGWRFTTGISYAMTGAVADADATVLVANDLILNISYK